MSRGGLCCYQWVSNFNPAFDSNANGVAAGFDHNFLPDVLIAVSSADDRVRSRSKFKFTQFKAAQFADPVNGNLGEIIRLDGDFYRCPGSADQPFQFSYPVSQLRSFRLDVPGLSE